MSKRNNTTTEIKNQADNNLDSLPNDDEFDLSVLEADIKEAEKEAKDQYTQRLIEQANIQKEKENLPEAQETPQDFKENLRELLDFMFSFINDELQKYDVSSFDASFIDQFIEKLIDVFPKETMARLQNVIKIGNKSKAGIKLMKAFKFISFITKEAYKRVDEYRVFKKVHKVDEQQKLLEKRD